MSLSVAKPMPALKHLLLKQKNEIRIVVAGICTLFLLLSSLQAASKTDSDTAKALQILQMNFNANPPTTQRTILREMALMDDERAVPFFVHVALVPEYDNEVRVEALKAMLAIDSQKYKVVLEVLQTPVIEDDRLIRNFQLIEGIDLLQPFLDSLTFKESRRIINMKLSAILHFWKKDQIRSYDFSRWHSKEAGDILYDSINNTNAIDQKIHLIELWGKVRNEKTTKEVVKWLDQPKVEVQEAVIFALSEPGPSAVSALGRFLQKSKNAELRKKTIFALRKIGDESSKVALKAYLPKATREEKKWIEDILRK